MTEKHSMRELAPLIEATVAAGGEFKLVTRGTSMLPLLRDGLDTAVLVAPPKKLKKNDIPLYRRKDGSFVLHRAVKVSRDGSSFCARGDNQVITEKNIESFRIVAVMTAVIRDGTRTDLDGTVYNKYVRKLPFHFLRLYIPALLRALKKKIFA